MSHEIKVERDEHPFVKEDSFHPALFISMQFSLASDSMTFPLAIKKMFNFRRADFITLYQNIYDVDWTEVMSCTDVNIALNTFYSILQGHYKIL